jgi:hypothetical protein
VSRRASLPGAEELFKKTSGGRSRDEKVVDKSPKLQVASQEEKAAADRPIVEGRKPPRHQEKITFYCTSEDLMALERARLKLRADHGLSADRGRIVRAALEYVLEDFEARSSDSLLLRRLAE